MATENPNRDLWYTVFAVGHPALKKFQNLHRWLPSPPRCKLCFAPFHGPGGVLMAALHKGPNSRNPNFCNACDKFLRAFPGGAEVELSILFVDVRESTGLAERLGATSFSGAINAFYREAIKIINATDGFVLGFVGDEVVAVYPPGFSGSDHARKAARAALELLELKVPVASDGSLIRLGVGVHSGAAFIGTATGAPEGIQDITALGDNVNIAARLASAALPGEALITEVTCVAAGLLMDQVDCRELELKGKTEPVAVRVIHAHAG